MVARTMTYGCKDYDLWYEKFYIVCSFLFFRTVRMHAIVVAPVRRRKQWSS
jgi:hypothetical protein